MGKRAHREFYGSCVRIAPQKPGALAQCKFCEWGRFFVENKRKRYSALARAAAALRWHARKVHGEKFPTFSVLPREWQSEGANAPV